MMKKDKISKTLPSEHEILVGDANGDDDEGGSDDRRGLMIVIMTMIMVITLVSFMIMIMIMIMIMMMMMMIMIMIMIMIIEKIMIMTTLVSSMTATKLLRELIPSFPVSLQPVNTNKNM